jgi:hypothetical protein
MSRSRPASGQLSFHKPTGQYYVTRNRKRVYLGADQDEPIDKYHRLALGLRTTPQLVTPRLLPRRPARQLSAADGRGATHRLAQKVGTL